MDNDTRTPVAGDPLADSVADLFGRLRAIAPGHQLLREWPVDFNQSTTNPLRDRLHGVVGYFIKRQTDHELLELQQRLQQALTPRLCVVNKRTPNA